MCSTLSWASHQRLSLRIYIKTKQNKTKHLSLFQTFKTFQNVWKFENQYRFNVCFKRVAGLYQTLGIARSASKRTIRLACADHGLFVFFSNKESQQKKVSLFYKQKKVKLTGKVTECQLDCLACGLWGCLGMPGRKDEPAASVRSLEILVALSVSSIRVIELQLWDESASISSMKLQQKLWAKKPRCFGLSLSVATVGSQTAWFWPRHVWRCQVVRNYDMHPLVSGNSETRDHHSTSLGKDEKSVNMQVKWKCEWKVESWWSAKKVVRRLDRFLYASTFDREGTGETSSQRSPVDLAGSREGP